MALPDEGRGVPLGSSEVTVSLAASESLGETVADSFNELWVVADVGNAFDCG